MDALKELLVFDSEAPRITTLTVLRKATSTIQQLRQRNEYLETCEDSEKQRFSQLMKRRQALRKKLDAKRNRNQKIQSWRERNRNYSECSVLTTSSEDSEMDYASRHLSTHMYSILPPSHPQQQQFYANDNHHYAPSYGITEEMIITTSNSQPPVATVTAPQEVPDLDTSAVVATTLEDSVATTACVASQEPNDISGHQKGESNSPQPSGANTSLSPTDAYDASSSDSGFEEAITAASAADEQQTLKPVPSVVSNNEEVVYTAYQSSDGFNAY